MLKAYSILFVLLNGLLFLGSCKSTDSVSSTNGIVNNSSYKKPVNGSADNEKKTNPRIAKNTANPGNFRTKKESKEAMLDPNATNAGSEKQTKKKSAKSGKTTGMPDYSKPGNTKPGNSRPVNNKKRSAPKKKSNKRFMS
ncbi:MAG: hypothetical protein ACK40G_00655 [Cytophagaceae bacterium]